MILERSRCLLEISDHGQVNIDDGEENLVQHLLDCLFRCEDASAQFAKQRHQSTLFTSVDELVLGRHVVVYRVLFLFKRWLVFGRSGLVKFLLTDIFF